MWKIIMKKAGKRLKDLSLVLQKNPFLHCEFGAKLKFSGFSLIFPHFSIKNRLFQKTFKNFTTYKPPTLVEILTRREQKKTVGMA